MTHLEERMRTVKRPPQQPGSPWTLLGRLLCLVGMHKYAVVEVIMGFGPGGSVAKLECERCQHVTTRAN